MRILMTLAPTVALLAAFPDAAAAQTAPAADALFAVNNTWMMVATFLVFVMHLGFATLESGLTQSKNTVNILFKNMGIIAIGLLTYTLVGFNLMYPDEFALGGYLGFDGIGIGTDAAGCDGRVQPRLHLLDGLPLPGDVRGHGGDDRVGCRGRAGEARFFPSSLRRSTSCSSIPSSGRGSGVGAGWTGWGSTILPVRRSSTPWAAGRRLRE